jgi:flagellar biosynthesis protein FlhG
MDQATNLREMVRKEYDSSRKLNGNNEDSSLLTRSRTKVIAVTSGKGGVGKTNVVANLAITFQRMGRSVLVFDADLGLANIDIIFGLNPKDNIEGVIKGEKELSKIIIEGPEGISIIPASSGVQDLTHLTEGQKINLLNEFDMLNDNFDVLLIDTGAGISSNVTYFNLAARERLVVVTPEPASITDAYALMKVMFYQHGTKEFVLLVNMTKDEKEAQSVYRSLSKVGTRFMPGICIDYAGYILWDRLLANAVSRREAVVCLFPEAPASKKFREVARHLLNKADERPIDGDIKFFWKRLIGVSVGGDNENENQ